MKRFRKKAEKKYKRYVILQSTLAEFQDRKTADAFINTQLEIRGFDLSKPVSRYTNDTQVLYEQES